MSRRVGAALVVAVVALGLMGCGDDDSRASAGPGSRAAGSSTSPSSSSTTPPPPTYTDPPPVRYRPEDPRYTVENDRGYPVDTCVPQRLRRYAVQLTDTDGVHLSALVLGSGTDGVVLDHEQGYSICSFLPLGRKLARDGYLVVLPEYRNHVASQATPDNEHLARDAFAALRELRSRGAKRIFVGGASCGGTTGIVSAATVPDLVGLLVMSSPAQCGVVDAIPSIRRITAPSLFIVSPGDSDGGYLRNVRELYAASGSSRKQLVLDDSGYHGTSMFRLSDHGARLEQRVLRFIEGTFNE